MLALKDLFKQNRFSVTVRFHDIPAAETLTKAWLTIKASPQDADPGVLQKAITNVLSAGIGQITDVGTVDPNDEDGDKIAVARFDFVNADTAALQTGRPYLIDFQALLSGGGPITGDVGTIVFSERVTQATS